MHSPHNNDVSRQWSHVELTPEQSRANELDVKAQAVPELEGSDVKPNHGMTYGVAYQRLVPEDDEGPSLANSLAKVEYEEPLPTSSRFLCCCRCEDPLLLATLVGVLLGILIGSLLRLANLSPTAIELVGFPGEIMLRLLKMLVLPLIAGSMISGVCALRTSTSGVSKLATCTLLYYFLSTLVAVIIGIVLVVVVQPGRGEPLGNASGVDCHGQEAGPKEAAAAPSASPALGSALLDIVRNMFPDNLVLAAVNMNILGIIVFSLMFGFALSALGPEADSWIHGIAVFNNAIGRMVSMVLWLSPVGIASLIAASICRACNLLHTLSGLGLWILVVMVGLAIMACVVLPLTLWITTRRNPLSVLSGFSPALMLAFGTSSSSAALPVTMDCARQLGCLESTVKFFLPLGTTVNMNGTALYEATTVMFIAQAHGVHLGLAQTVVVAGVATLAAVGAAAIPSAGLVTMMMVMQAVNLDQFASDLAVILAIDWLLDRCRTAVNTQSDAFGCVVVDHISRANDRGRPHGSYMEVEMN